MCSKGRYEGIPVEHLYMLLDDIRSKIEGIQENGGILEKGYPLFHLVYQKIEVEQAINCSQIEKGVK